MTIARKLALLVLFALFGMVVMTAWFLVSERKLILEERKPVCARWSRWLMGLPCISTR